MALTLMHPSEEILLSPQVVQCISNASKYAIPSLPVCLLSLFLTPTCLLSEHPPRLQDSRAIVDIASSLIINLFPTLFCPIVSGRV